MPDTLPLRLESDRQLVDGAFVHVLRLALRGVAAGDQAALALADRFDAIALRRTLDRFERLLADEWTPTWDRARSIVAAALADRAVGRTA